MSGKVSPCWCELRTTPSEFQKIVKKKTVLISVKGFIPKKGTVDSKITHFPISAIFILFCCGVRSSRIKLDSRQIVVHKIQFDIKQT